MHSLAKEYKRLKALIYKLDKGKCHICGRKVSYKEAVLDHIVPKAVSGRGSVETSDEYWNLALAHRRCNLKRSNAKTPGQLRLNFKEVQDATVSRM